MGINRELVCLGIQDLVYLNEQPLIKDRVSDAIIPYPQVTGKHADGYILWENK